MGRRSREIERLALIRRGVSDLAHDLSKSEREGIAYLEEQMFYLDPPYPRALVAAYDEVLHASSVSRKEFAAAEAALVDLIHT